MWASFHAAALTLALTATPAEIAYVSDAGIFSAKADGSAATLLVEGGGQPAWSPDASTLAYVTGTDSNGHIMLREPGGTRRLTRTRAHVTDSGPAWAPDGATIAFARLTESDERYTTRIVTHDVATGTERVLVKQELGEHLSSVGTAVWSRDGAMLAYTLTRYDRHLKAQPEIRVIPAHGGSSRRLIAQAQELNYSPDGTRVAYASIKDHNGERCDYDECQWAGELYVANADGSNPRRLTRDKGDITLPQWSADGSRLLFASDRNLPQGNSSEVYSIGADGSCLTWLTNGTPASFDPVWRPNSGDSFTANCDPTARPATYRPPDLIDYYQGNLWLGSKIDGLVLSATDGVALYYADCERFSGCPHAVTLIAELDPCALQITPRHKLSVQHGWLVADLAGPTPPLVFGGKRATSVDADRLTDLTPRRREKALVGRAALKRLSAGQKAKLRPYRACGRA